MLTWEHRLLRVLTLSLVITISLAVSPAFAVEVPASRNSQKNSIVANYPVVNSVRLQTFAVSAIFDLSLNSTDVPKAYILKDKGGQRVRIKFTKDMITRDTRRVVGNKTFLRAMYPKESTDLTEYLELNPPYYTIYEYVFIFEEPVNYTYTQEPGSFKVQFEISNEGVIERERRREKLIEDYRRKDNLRSVEGVLGSSARTQQDFSDVISGRVDDATSFSRLAKIRRKYDEEQYWKERLELRTWTEDDFYSDEVVLEFLKKQAPKFGSWEYWKQHISGAFAQTNYYTTDFNDSGQGSGSSSFGGSSGRGRTFNEVKDDAIILEPSGSIVYTRRGITEFLAAYNLQKRFIFMNQIDTFDLDRYQSFRFGVNRPFEASPHPRWFYSVQTSLDSQDYTSTDRARFRGGVTANERVTSSNVSLGILYLLAENTQINTGLGYQRVTYKNSGNFSSGLANFELRHQFNERLTGFILYNYSRPFAEDNFDNPASRQNNISKIHHFGIGFEYDRGANQFRYELGVDVIEGEVIVLPLGETNFRHDLSPRSQINLRMSNRVVSNTTGRRFEEVDSSIPRERDDGTENKVQVVSYQDISLSFHYIMTPRLSFEAAASISRIQDIPGVTSSDDVDKFTDFQLHAALKKNIFRGNTAVELRYQYNYYTAEDTNEISVTTGDRTDGTNDKRKSSEHRIFLRFIYFFGSGGAR